MRPLSRPGFFWLCLCVMLGGFVVSVIAGDIKVKATLVWGTDEEKPNDPSLKPVDPNMVSNFREVCKWKHYFEVTNALVTVSQNATNRVRLSPKCEIEIQNLGSMGLAAKFFGENKLIYEGKSKVEPGKHWGIGGGDKNATAWFVILTPQ